MKNIKKIARLCWNKNLWTSPSGYDGKVQHLVNGKKPFEFSYGFGHEEWLLDKTKALKGYMYGFLQPLNNGLKQHRNDYKNTLLDISLYTICWKDLSKNHKYWIGELKNVEIVQEEESIAIYDIYENNNWIQDRVESIVSVNAEWKELAKLSKNDFFNIKFKMEDINIYAKPRLIDDDDKTIDTYYYNLIDKINEPKLVDNGDSYYKEITKPNFYVIGSHYGKGEEADVFDEWMQRGIVSIGFAPDFDLSHLYLHPRVEIKDYVLKKVKDEYKKNSAQNVSLFLNLKPGDILAIKTYSMPYKGKIRLNIRAYAVVVERDGLVYSYSNDLGHCINVQFIDKDLNFDFEFGGITKTINLIKDEFRISKIFNSYYDFEHDVIPKYAKRKMKHYLRTKGASTKGTKEQFRRGHQGYVATQKHNIIQLEFLACLQDKYGYDKVELEKDRVDIKVNFEKSVFLYEVKRYDRPVDCIIEALGQILNYAYIEHLNKANIELKLFVVGPEEPDEYDKEYIEYVKDNLQIPFDYISFRLNSKILL